MASNFKIFLHQDKGSVHLDLSGDFDGSSACQLIHMLKTYHGKGQRFYIDTSSFSDIHPFGLGLFHKDCVINNLSEGLTFTGKNGAILAPESRNRA